ncbi:MAG: molybdopterin-dependent oxidoreductase [Streptosporangiaceae bacterium]|jgi:DMSO/TMAO reductase YedYZ molybdopterin-dependent catalytic subunit
MGQPDGGRSVLGHQAPGHQPLGHQPLEQSLVSQVLAGAAGGRVWVGRELPPGQVVRADWPARHYGRVPRFRPDTWTFTVMGTTESGVEHRWDWAAISRLPRCSVTADLHCVTKCTVPGIAWEGIAAAEILSAAPPAGPVTHVMVWAEYGYSANIGIDDFAADTTLFATAVAGVPLTPEHGYPIRLVVPHLYGWKSVKWVRAVEYLTENRRGFWEERGYHNSADPWHEERFSHQE